MGQTQSSNLYNKIYQILPEADGNSHGSWFSKENKPFAGDKDRQQFIHAVITVITNNGQLTLKDYQFRLLFSRRPNDRVVARIVAELDSVIRAKIEPEEDGKDQTEAFMCLKRDVEMKLEGILQEVPSDGADVVLPGPSRAPQPSIAGSSRGRSVAAAGSLAGGPLDGRVVLPSDAPPAYEGGDVKRKPTKR